MKKKGEIEREGEFKRILTIRQIVKVFGENRQRNTTTSLKEILEMINKTAALRILRIS